MSDLRDPERAERLAAEDPDGYLRRREFLARTAAAAGLGTGAALLLHPDRLVGEAAAAQGRAAALPAGRNLPIDTFVVLMMENRSFDHYLGWLPGADGMQSGLTYKNAAGQSFATHRLTGDFQGCAHPDPDHSWGGGREQFNNGRMDGFLRSGTNDVFSIGYYAEDDLPFIPHVAQAFTTFDRFFCSLLASTYPNREYMHSGQSYGKMDNAVPVETLGFPDTTIFAALARAGVSSRYFYTDIPFSALWGAAGLARSGQVQEYYERCATGTLPAVSFVDPAFNGEDQGTSGDEHPHGDVRTGQAFMADVVHAFMESPQFKRGALFIVYDEWGGFFDHVAPPRVPDDRSNTDINTDFGQMGLRIPAVAISPWARRGHVDHGIYGFESILKMIRHRYGLPPLTRRDKYARNIARAFDFDAKPRLDLPDLPRPAHVISAACGAAPVGTAAAASGAATRPKEHDVVELLTSGYLDRLGFKYQSATPARTFRHPSSLGLTT
ncbi:MAG TPA: alkaline phosphatase family protein [Baekduia sp.]|nr:alkaline phosphatase family protein [Baekduia sp.]